MDIVDVFIYSHRSLRNIRIFRYEIYIYIIQSFHHNRFNFVHASPDEIMGLIYFQIKQ